MHDERQPALIDADRRRLVRAASRLLGPSDAEDAVQDAYVRALEAEALELNAAQAWLLTVVRNLAVDRLRRRHWMQQWLAQAVASHPVHASPSAEMDAALAEDASRALRLLAAHLAPADGAVVLLHEVFELGHAEIAQASGRSETASRQQLRRALLRLRRAGSGLEPRPSPQRESSEEVVFRMFLQSLRLRDPQILWAMLGQPPVSASARACVAAAEAVSAPAATSCGVVQMGGQLGLVLTLDGVRLCVLPLGVRTEHEPETVAL
ncbi:MULTISPECIES: sigma-70 family RNA polymerase sigma factor [unclassified Acidovorax]|uniref:sigma-70 family RNA polymerase sigma factor n=1 Tax=unclassified Acidovorax TaxID=2684926 RepID=UPI001C48812B|nr:MULTISPECIES: sigma-70 family RNA polymerase sigma factor [unclassified Acidovorax]MBV7428279.1 sigma-70 family RNA polymerase sigma factor [Acidovorax sp. sif0732]MBV7449536.1 sigma-70 family RNA polymerase sigma factor [Acidovorax sp. sif0715]